MGGGHIARNLNNMQETDEEMLGKIQRIDTIKFNPNHWHLNMFDPSNWFRISGGAPTMMFTGCREKPCIQSSDDRCRR